MGTGLDGAVSCLSRLRSLGVRTVVVCPGGRNAPLVQALELATTAWGMEAPSFVDERSAAFFALARARRDGRPVAVSVTSGTAAAELLPAAIEAHANGVPLILLTADRPRSHRGSGSPQSMWQVGLFTRYAPTVVDWEEGEVFPDWHDGWDRRSPLHLNLCFQEPRWVEAPVALPAPAADLSPPTSRAPAEVAYPTWKNPLVLLGALAPEERPSVEAFCRWYGAPVLAEASSGLRHVDAPMFARAADRVVRSWFRSGRFDGVLRLGGVPSWRLWRDLEKWEGPLLTVGRSAWSGLPGRDVHRGELAPWLEGWRAAGPRCDVRADFHQEDVAAALRLDGLHAEYPQSEPALVRGLSIRAATGAMVYLGNSRPVRDWNEHADRRKSFEIQENRGLNGIDGQVSAFYGHCRDGAENWALLGDLTTIYDLQGPWAVRHLAPGTRSRLVVVNNHGGRIFERMFPTPGFLNVHQLGFEGFARMWGLSHGHNFAIDGDHAVVELRPEAGQTRAFRERWEKL